jgi:TolB-like protein/predicted Ser/Thr protein kinase/Tfp pilus assembly protein PilF
MISALRLCPRCGLEIPADAPEGGCPGCLLERGLRLLADEAVAGADLSAGAAYSAEAAAKAGSAKTDDLGPSGEPAPAATKSQRLAEMLGELGDYELLEEVGRGGQGVVFRARQKSLDRIVALKVISLGQWASEAHLKRFRREAHAAASLDHPSIVPIYEVGERDGSCYFSMKFVEGGQLDEVVRQTPMSIRQAAELIAKVARTVHYAHEHGILHRDIKPGNILLDRNGEPHLTDFGLARLLDTQSSVTRTIDVLGTPSYMAPEQAAGETTKLSKATDVYGLGAVLYQLVTGQPPFAGGTTYETIRLLRDTDPRPPRLLNPKLGREVSTICLKCLEKDPKRRYSSALALAEDLEHWLKHEPIQAKRSGFFTHAWKSVRRKPAIAALIAALVALAAALGWNVWESELFRAAPEKSIAVLPFENLSRDPENAYFADGMQDEILTDLVRIADLKVISRSSVMQYKSGVVRNLREIGHQLRVANVVEGSLERAGNRLRVRAQLIDARTDRSLWAQTYDRELADVFAIQSEIAKAIASQLQAKITGREEQALAVKPTSDSEAYAAYLRGLAFEARSYSLPGTSDEAAGFYEQAVQLDPNFAVAWARLSRMDALLYFDRVDSTTAARGDAAKGALENAQKLAPDSPETLLALGYYQYLVLRDNGSAKITFGRVSKTLPGSSEAPRALGYVTRREGQWDQSIAYFERALSLDPRNSELLMSAAQTYTALRQFPTALRLYDRALDTKPNDPDVMAAKASVYQAQGNLQEAARFLSQITAETPSQSTFTIKITQLRLERNYGEAIRLLQTRSDQVHFRSQFLKASNQVVLALTQRLAGDTVGAKITAEAALNTLQQFYRDQPDYLGRVFSVGQLSQAYAAMGQKDSALEAAERAIILLQGADSPADGPMLEVNLALVETIFGENSRAISTLTQLLQRPYGTWGHGVTPITPAFLRLDPFWDRLRSDPAFQKLCEEKQP